MPDTPGSLDTLEEYNLFAALYTPVTGLYETEAYRQVTGVLVNGENATAIFLWPAVAGAEDMAATAHRLFEEQCKTNPAA